MSRGVHSRYSTTALVLCVPLLAGVPAAVAQDIPPTAVEEGRAIALNRAKGNCVVCHAVPGIEFHGDIAPPLVGMKQRFPDRERLRAQVYDATHFNTNSVMPPFGRHEILTRDEIDKVLEWLLTL